LKSTATNKKTTPEDAPLSASRRRFISWGIIGIAGIIAGTFIVPLVELAGRRTAGKRLVFFDAIPLDDMPETGMKKVELAIRGGALYAPGLPGKLQQPQERVHMPVPRGAVRLRRQGDIRAAARAAY
jgi:hypothetical protein